MDASGVGGPPLVAGGVGERRLAPPVADAAPAPPPANLAVLMGHDTEAGRMMARLYGRPVDPTPIPKPRTAGPWQPASAFRAALPAPGALDPTVPTLNRAAMREVDESKPVPWTAPPPHVAAVDTIPSRRSASQIAEGAAAAAASADAVLPPVKRGYNNPDAEKRRLQATFAHKGGKALPSAGLPEPLQGHLPLSAMAAPSAPPVGAAGRRAARAALLPAADPDASTPAGALRSLESRAAELRAEIAERKAFLAEMAALGRGREYEALITGECGEKERDLRGVEKAAAAARKEIQVMGAAARPPPPPRDSFFNDDPAERARVAAIAAAPAAAGGDWGDGPRSPGRLGGAAASDAPPLRRGNSGLLHPSSSSSSAAAAASSGPLAVVSASVIATVPAGAPPAAGAEPGALGLLGSGGAVGPALPPSRLPISARGMPLRAAAGGLMHPAADSARGSPAAATAASGAAAAGPVLAVHGLGGGGGGGVSGRAAAAGTADPAAATARTGRGAEGAVSLTRGAAGGRSSRTLSLEAASASSAGSGPASGRGAGGASSRR